MKSSLKLFLGAIGRSLLWPFYIVDRPTMRAFLVACALLLSCAPVGAEYNIYWTVFPYDGSQSPQFPSDISRMVFGRNPADACSKRTADEIIATHRPAREDLHPIVFVGMLNPNSCGFQWVNDPYVINEPMITPASNFCSQTTNWPANWPSPPKCALDCPDTDKINGNCPPSTPKNGGTPCPKCGNPVNPGTGNKFQEETDYAAIADGQLSFVRYYNSGLPAVNMAVGGFWSHTFNSRVVIDGTAAQVSYTRADGREYTFNLQSGSWVGDADVSDVLTELKDANGRRTGWRYRIAANEDTEVYDASGSLTAIERRNGLTLTLVYSDGTDGASSGNGGFVLDASGNPTATLLPKGLLLRAVDQFGKRLTFGYDTYSRIVKMTDPAGGAYLYSYGPMSGVSNLLSVTYPDGHQRAYAYNEPANTSGTNKPNALTGITDENGFRFASYKYNDVGRAIESVHHTGTGDVQRYQLTYTVSAAQTSVTDPLGTVRNYGFQNVLGVIKNNAVDLPEPSVPGANVAYDLQGNISSRTDWNGNRTNYTYDLARNLETSRTEGLTSSGGTTPQTRTITTEWHATFRLPARIAEPLRVTTNVYDADGTQCGARGALCSRSIQATTDATGAQGLSGTPSGAPRTWTYTYNANSSPLTVKGPRTDASDLTTYTYYANNDADLGKRGNVATITNAAGHLTSITAYNAHGQPLTIVDPNGMTITLAYDARQRLVSRNSGGEVTNYDYDGVGQVTKVTLPDGSFLSYTYDAAHRLTGMQDNLGNSIAYTLDAMGNRTLEQVFDPASALAQKRSRVYSSLNRLFQELGAQNQTTEYAYDNQGNVVSVKDPLNQVTSNQYDALNRLAQVTDPNLGVAQYAYNGLDALTQVTDPRGLVTGYTVDGLGNLAQQSSPDTGTTVNTYDTAGNLATQTDAKGQVTRYSYDALNRVTLITFHDQSKQAYAYDQGANAKGRLSSITETNAANAVTNQIAYAYDLHGRVTSETRTVNGVQYALSYTYDMAGRLSGLTYPSGRTVTYAFDALGRVSQVTTTKATLTQVVVQNVAYQPFGGVKGFTLGNGQVYSRGIDLDGRIASYTLGAQSFGIGYDAASRIEFISDFANPANANTYSYDALDRLTQAVTPGTPYAYSYDAVGNRTSRSAGAGTDTYAYSSGSNRIASIQTSSGSRSFVFDANGSTTADGNNTYAYDARGRMVQATSSLGPTTYQVNALGQRFRKTNSLGDTVFQYDTRGRLIAETDPAGALGRELIYLGDIPVAVVQ
jgi:YD repeat-containing protein